MLLLLATASAGTIDGGVQAALYPGGIDVARGFVEGETFRLEYDELSGEYDCYDEVGVRDVNLDIPIESVSFSLQDDYLDLHIRFGTIRGERMILYGRDADYLDLCAEFETEVYYVELQDGELHAKLSASIEGGEVAFSTVGTPTITGDFDSDINNFPDDLVLAFFEDTLLEYLGEGIGAYVPGVLADYVNDSLFSGNYGAYQMALAPADVKLSPSKLGVGATSTVSWRGDAACKLPTATARNSGRSPTLDFGDGDDSSIGVGVTEALLNETFQTLWTEGYFCFGESYVATLLDSMDGFIDPGVGSLSASASLEEAPSVSIEKGGVAVSLPGAVVDVRGQLKGKEVQILALTADIAGTLDIGIDPDLSAFTMGLRGLSLDFRRFEAEHLVSDSKDAEEHLRDFLENWVATWAEAQDDDLVLFDSLYRTWGMVLRVDRIAYEPGGLRVYASIFEEDDPRVDNEAPQTAVEVAKVDGEAVARFSAADDRDGAIAWSYRVDRGPWSDWSVVESAALGTLSEGSHTLEAVSRDSWLNVDDSPAKVEFDVAALAEEDAGEGCGCGNGAAPSLGTLVTAALAGRFLRALVARRARRG
ncbi:MAG: hypothetical protein FJ102_18520 [Deltaproteobacteria bacterium]|nr:hypothetical protein [Deltaproteobacteria bacterium]